jgi:leucyl aminopeptidase
MKIDLTNEALAEIKTRALVIAIFEDNKKKIFNIDNPELIASLNKMVDSGEITGKYKEFTLIHNTGIKADHLLIMGLGKKINFSLERLMAISAVAARNMRRIKIDEMTVENNFDQLGINAEDGCRAIVEGITLGLYKFKKISRKQQPDYQTIKNLKIAVASTNKVVRNETLKGEILGQATNRVRDLVNYPANLLTPQDFIKHAKELAKKTNLKIKVLDHKALEKENMNALLAVGSGSYNKPAMVILEHRGTDQKGQTLGFVGKGVTFDSGGLSLKPRDHMFRMHCDMAGAASVLGAMECIAKNNLPVNVVAVMPLTENLVDSTSYKVGDVISTREGITVEILNTDAEGRLIMADALSFIRSYSEPDYLVDIATLTGAIVTTLGHFCSGAMTNNQEFYKIMEKASEQSCEKIWQLPVFDDYLTQISSDIADLENSGGSPAGSITAAIFLKQFVGQTPWIHLDIAGTAWMDESTMTYMKNPFLPKEGGTGAGTRLLYHLAEILSS